jgi:hypothetical protein
MALIDVYMLYQSDSIRGRAFAAIAKAARDVLNEVIPTSNLASDANSGQANATLVGSGGGVFWVGKTVIISDSGNSEEVTIKSIASDVLTFTTNLVHSYTTANSGKVTFKDNIERLTWAQNTRKEMDEWVNTFMWDIVSNASIQTAGESCTDNDIQYVINANINAYASTLIL